MALTPPVLPKNGFTSPAYGLKNTTVSNVQPTNSVQPDYKSLYQNYYNTFNNNDYSNVMKQAQDSAARAANQKRMGYQSSLNLLGSNLNTGLSGVNSSLDSNKQDLQDRTFQNYLASRQSVANSGLSGTGLANDADARVQMANNRSLANIERDANQQKYALQNAYNTQSQSVQDQMNAIDQAGMAQDLFNQMKGQEMQARAQQANGMLNYIQALQSQDQRNIDNQWKQKTFDTQNEQWNKTFDRQGKQQDFSNAIQESGVTGRYAPTDYRAILDQIQQNKQINATTQDEAARQQAQQSNLQLYKDLLSKYGVDGQTLFNGADTNANMQNFANAYQGFQTMQKQAQDRSAAMQEAGLTGYYNNQPTMARSAMDFSQGMDNQRLGLQRDQFGLQRDQFNLTKDQKDFAQGSNVYTNRVISKILGEATSADDAVGMLKDLGPQMADKGVDMKTVYAMIQSRWPQAKLPAAPKVPIPTYDPSKWDSFDSYLQDVQKLQGK